MLNPKRASVLIMTSVWLGHFSVDFMLGIWAVYKTIAELDLALCGLIIAVCAFIGEGLQGFFGTISDRGYRSHLIVIGILLSASSAFLAYTDNYLLIFIILLFTLIGSGAFHPSAASLVHSLSAKRPGLLMSVFQSGGGAGLAVSQLLFFWVYYEFEGHTYLLSIPILLLAIFLVCNKWALDDQQAAPKNKAHFRDIIGLFKHRELRLLYIVQVCNQSIVWGFLFLLPDVLVSRGYETWVCFGGGHLAMVSGMTLFLAPIGYLADKFSLKKVVIGALGGGIIAVYLLLLTPFFSTPMILSLLFLIGACLGSVSPLNVVYGNSLVPDRAGIVSAFLMGLVWCVAEGIGQFGGGLLTKLFVDDAPARALGCLGLLFFVGLAAYSRLPEKAAIEPELQKG